MPGLLGNITGIESFLQNWTTKAGQGATGTSRKRLGGFIGLVYFFAAAWMALCFLAGGFAADKGDVRGDGRADQSQQGGQPGALGPGPGGGGAEGEPEQGDGDRSGPQG